MRLRGSETERGRDERGSAELAAGVDPHTPQHAAQRSWSQDAGALAGPDA